MWALVNGTVEAVGQRVDVAARAERDRASRRARRWASSSVSPAGITAVPPGARPATSSALAAAIASIEPSSSRCTGATLVMTADVGLGDLRQLGDLAGAAHRPSRARAPRSPAGASRTVSGSPISVLRFSRLATVAPLLAEHRGEDVLRRGLAGRAGDPDHGAAELAAPRGGEALERQRAGRRRR